MPSPTANDLASSDADNSPPLPTDVPAESAAVTVASAGSRLGGMSELLRIAVPLILSSGSLSLMSAADRMILTGYSTAALAAITPASMLHWTVVCIPLGTVLYANTFMSQCEGAGQRDRMMAWFWQCVWLAVISGMLLIGLVPFSERLLAMTGQPPEVVRLEAEYFNVLCAGSVILLGSMALSCFFSGRRQTTVVMVVNMIGVVLNFLLGYVLVFGKGPFPEMGIRGAALATLLARCSDILIYVVLICRQHRILSLPWGNVWRPNLTLMKGYLRYGLPSGLHYFLDNSGFTIFLLIVGSLNSDALAATNLAFSVNGLIFLPLLGFGTAIQTVVGHHLGAGLVSAASRTTWNAVRLGILWTGFAGLVLVIFPDAALQPFLAFTTDAGDFGREYAGVMNTAVILLRFVAVYSVFDALAVVMSSALRGAGDTLFPMLVTMCSSWVVMVGGAWLIRNSGYASVNALWMCCSVHISLTGTCMLLRFLTGRWKKLHIAVKD